MNIIIASIIGLLLAIFVFVTINIIFDTPMLPSFAPDSVYNKNIVDYGYSPL